MAATDDLIVGIDLGTTHSLVGLVDSGFPIILADGEGRRLLPSVVCRTAEGMLTGHEALRSRALHPEATAASIKRLIGRRFGELTEADWADFPGRLSAGAEDTIRIDLGEGESRTPEELSADLLRRIRSIAEAALEEPVHRAVITVPAYFGNAQREATKRAAEAAGWRVERILNEPTAAALAYGLDPAESGERIAVYDLGGGTFDLSVLELREGVFEVLATSGDTRLGGDDIDRAIANWFLAESGMGTTTLSAEQESRLLDAARKAKETLSDAESASLDLPFFAGEKSLSRELTREALEILALPLLERTRVIGQQALLEARQKSGGEIDHLILVGGSTRIPLVRAKVEEWFGREPNLSQHPDEAVAIGAAIQAGVLCGRVRQVVLVDVTPLSLGIETIGGLMNVIIPRNTTIPAKAGELFTNAVAQQASMAVRVLQGEREMAQDNWLLGEIAVPFDPGPKGSARVGVEFSIDENGILTVLTRDTKTGRDHILEIEDAAVDVNDEAVERMIDESVDHAYEDMTKRLLAETRLKSEELLPAVESALALAGDRIASAEREEIESAAEEVRAQLAANPPSLETWKAANQRLDEVTESLAAVVVEMALEQSLADDT